MMNEAVDSCVHQDRHRRVSSFMVFPPHKTKKPCPNMGQDIVPAVPPKLTQSARSSRTDIRAAEDNGPRSPSAATCGCAPLSAALTSPFAGDPLLRSHCPQLAERRFIPVTILAHRFCFMVRIIAPCFRLSSFFFIDLNYPLRRLCRLCICAGWRPRPADAALPCSVPGSGGLFHTEVCPPGSDAP